MELIFLTIFLFCISDFNLPVFTLLVENGLDLNYEIESKNLTVGQHIFKQAYSDERHATIKVIEYLTDQGIYRNEIYFTADGFYRACLNNTKVIMEYILNNYSIANDILDKALYTVLDQNKSVKSKSMIELLANYGANPANLISFVNKNSTIKMQNTDYLIELGADPVVLLKLIIQQ